MHCYEIMQFAVKYFTRLVFKIYYRCYRGWWSVDGWCCGTHGNNSAGIIWRYQ